MLLLHRLISSSLLTTQVFYIREECATEPRERRGREALRWVSHSYYAEDESSSSAKNPMKYVIFNDKAAEASGNMVLAISPDIFGHVGTRTRGTAATISLL